MVSLLFSAGLASVFAQEQATAPAAQTTDSAHIQTLLQQGKQRVDSDPQAVRDTLLPEINRLLANNPNQQQKLTALELAFWANVNLGQEEEAQKILDERLHTAEAMNEEGILWYATALTDRAVLAFYGGRYRDAIADNRQALKLQEGRAVPAETAETLNNLGVLHRRLGEYEVSLDYNLRALALYREAGNNAALAKTYNNIGMVYQTLKRNEKALEYFEKAVVLKEQLEMHGSLATTIGNMGFVFMSTNQLEKARDMFDRALNIRADYGDPLEQTQAHLNAARIYRLLGDLPKARVYSERALALAAQIDRKEPIGECKLELALLTQQEGDAEAALRLMEEAMDLLKDVENSESIAIAYRNYASIAADNGQWEKAYRIHQHYKELQDRLFNAEAARAVTGLHAKFENDQREAEIERLKRENQSKADEVRAQRRLRHAWILSLVLLFSVLTALVARHHARRKYEREKELNDELTRLDRLKDDFLANTSHELRTPLNGIIGLAESLADGATGELGDATKRNLDMIIASGKRLGTLIDDLLDYSKIANQSLRISTRPLQLHGVVEMVLNVSRPMLGTKPIDILNQIPVGLPLVQADENRLIQIFHNLIHNAIKFTLEGQITVRAHAGESQVVIEVTDTGIGIPSEHFDAVFKAFQQVEGAITRRHPGTGLGLAITKELVSLHRGSIWVESLEGQGTCFSFTLPIAVADSTSQAPEPAEAEASPTKVPAETDEPTEKMRAVELPSFKAFRILVVDDEEVNRQVLVNHLSIRDYEVVEAASGTEALAKLNEPQGFQLVLLDVMMPNTSGYQVCEEIRRRWSPSELPVLFLTAKSRLQDLVRGFTVGANDYLTKPVTKEELLARVDIHAQLARAGRDQERRILERTAGLQRQNQELETLNEIVKTVNREVEIKALAQTLLDQALNLLPQIKSGGLLLRDHQTNHFTFAALVGYDARSVSPIRFDFQEAMRRYTGHIGLADGVWLISNPGKRPGREKFAGLPMPGSLLTVTLPVDDYLLEGILIFDNESNQELIRESDIARLIRFREHAITALNKACHVEKLLKTTESLRVTQRRLIETAHLAGRAEIAASVLHNLGNALNSVVASAMVIQDRLDTERVRKTLSRIARHLSKSETTDDAAGAKVTPQNLALGIAEIVEIIHENERHAGEEVLRLVETIEGIRDIVSAQESYSQVAGYSEDVDLRELFQELIQAEKAGMSGLGIPISAEITAQHRVPLQRFKLITVLHHLIGNAARAIQQKGGEGEIHIHDAWHDNGRFRIVVSDNGIGIASEELSAIFSRGHSRPGNEHDLSLHLTANTITDMGGRLWAESDGIGHGARFIIELPDHSAVEQALKPA